MIAEPLIRSPWVALLLIVGTIVLACALADLIDHIERVASRRRFIRAGRRMGWDARDRQRHFDNIVGNRK